MRGLRRLVFWAAVTAAAVAGARVYVYDGGWEYTYGPGEYYDFFWTSWVSGDDSYIGALYFFWYNVTGTVGLGFLKFTGGGFLVQQGYFYSGLGAENPWFTPYGLIFYNGDPLAAFDYSAEIYPGKIFGVLSYYGIWTQIKPRPKLYGALAKQPHGPYFYCYREWEGGKDVCKMTRAGAVVSYFKPAVAPVDMAATDDGVIYLAAQKGVVLKYNDSGALLTSWRNPAPVRCISYDGAGLVLVYGEDNKTYVYDAEGGLIEAFNVKPQGSCPFAEVGPEGKYYVLSCTPVSHGYGPPEIKVYCARFARARGVNATPASVGKIKALFK